MVAAGETRVGGVVLGRTTGARSYVGGLGAACQPGTPLLTEGHLYLRDISTCAFIGSLGGASFPVGRNIPEEMRCKRREVAFQA